MDEYQFCRICGLDQSPEGIRDERGLSNYHMCMCCAAEFGINDETVEEVQQYRARWFATEPKWFFSKNAPADWSFEQQLSNVPPEFR